MHKLKKSKRLNKDKVNLKVGNGVKVVALAGGTYYFTLSSGLILQLNNCYFVSIHYRNIISISYLALNEFIFIIKGKCWSFFYKNSDFYASEDYINSLYILDFEIPLFNINFKKNRLDNKYPSYLWHYRLDRINETRIVKLHKERYFDHFKYESYETCEDCLLGKLTRTPLNRKSERSKESLGLIHTDVCRPMMIYAIGGYTYFIIFIDDHFRYYCVYLIKCKSESF